jgi:prepilin-type N-terminal cleavage/methylation domain-containing protein
MLNSLHFHYGPIIFFQQISPMKLKNLLAFTLIELLVVISIIAVLAGLAVPAISGAMENGKVVQDLNNLRQIGLGFRIYAGDNDNVILGRETGKANWAAILRFGGDGSVITGSGSVPDSKIFRSPFDPARPVNATGTSALSYAFNKTTIDSKDWDLFDQITGASSLALVGPSSTNGKLFTGTLASPTVLSKEIVTGTQKGGKFISLLFADLHVEAVRLDAFKGNGTPQNPGFYARN